MGVEDAKQFGGVHGGFRESYRLSSAITSIVRRAIFSPSSNASAEEIAGLAVATTGYPLDASTRAPIGSQTFGSTRTTESEWSSRRMPALRRCSAVDICLPVQSRRWIRRVSNDVCTLLPARISIDVVHAPDGIESFDAAWSHGRNVDGYLVCHIDDVIASRRSANREKDRENLSRLEIFRRYLAPKRITPGKPLPVRRETATDGEDRR